MIPKECFISNNCSLKKSSVRITYLSGKGSLLYLRHLSNNVHFLIAGRWIYPHPELGGSCVFPVFSKPKGIERRIHTSV